MKKLFLIALSCISLAGFAQRKSPCASEPHTHDFDYWIGEWDVYQTGTQTLVGHSVVQSISGGCGLLENWTDLQGGSGKSINYYDLAAGKWEQDWVGSGGTAQHYLNGEYRDSVMHFTFERMMNGKKITGNFKFYNLGPNTVRQYQDINKGDGTVTVSYDLTYVRKNRQ